MMNRTNRTQITRITLIFLIFLIGCSSGGEVEEGEPETAVLQPTLPPTQENIESPTPTTETIVATEPTTAPEPSPTVAATTAPESTGQANADVEYVRAIETAVNIWTFHVTVAHPDTGWEDYADGWDVVLPDGTVLLPNPENPFTRLLLHPHETEQPFTRSQANIEIPVGITAVTVRAHDIVDGFGGVEVKVDLTQASGENFEVQRLEN